MRFVLPIVFALTALALLAGPAMQKRRDREVASLMLTVQRALQDYHVREEAYPLRSPQSGTELITLLLETEHLTKAPINPWSGRPYLEAEAEPTDDRLRYGTDSIGETYSLEALEADGESVHLILDSTDHPSLE